MSDAACAQFDAIRGKAEPKIATRRMAVTTWIKAGPDGMMADSKVERAPTRKRTRDQFPGDQPGAVPGRVAADAYLATPDMGPFPIAKGYRIDIAAAVEASAFARSVMADPGADEVFRRKAVRTAILLARPVKA